MDAKEFELPIEGSLGKLALLKSGQQKRTKASYASVKEDKKTKQVKKLHPGDTKKIK